MLYKQCSPLISHVTANSRAINTFNLNSLYPTVQYKQQTTYLLPVRLNLDEDEHNRKT